MTELENELLIALESALAFIEDGESLDIGMLVGLIERVRSQPGFKTATRMTLLELLVKELDEWPEGVEFLAQDEGSKVYGYNNVKPEMLDVSDNSWTCRYSKGGTLAMFEMACSLSIDWQKTIITREQWEAAKNALS